ncbi:19959_t:CDS:2 [Cetraspora pellucida]|uniref:19959_t:CDS:1 n=1 Tax=Cetraspora pellucida TaxID=1433469 RepID=A0A9N9H1I7_9GLOM|nr:19959_t:CDS:2 [Cetraspora pellucida]
MSLLEKIEINIEKPQNDTIKLIAQNNATFTYSDHLSPSYTPANELTCDIDYDELLELKYKAQGGFGRIYTALWREQLVAAKFIVRENSKDFTRELRALRKSKECEEHIIKFFGLSKDKGTGEYIFVMKYADSGSLKDYLTQELTLDHKISLCKDIIKGLAFLHKHNIIHRDLHPNNVLIHQERALLADFGLSKSLLSKTLSKIRGIPPYVDPRVLIDDSDYPHPLEVSYDIYSFGVLMWEIYTCSPPFSGRNFYTLNFQLCMNGLREKRIVGMPMDYVKIYEKCWSNDPSDRPNTTRVLKDLEKLKKQPTVTKDDIKNIQEDHDSKLSIITTKELEKVNRNSNDNVQQREPKNNELHNKIEGEDDKNVNLMIEMIDDLKAENLAMKAESRAKDEKLLNMENMIGELCRELKNIKEQLRMTEGLNCNNSVEMDESTRVTSSVDR